MSGPKYSYAYVDMARLRKQIAELEAQIEESKCVNIKKQIEAVIKLTNNVIAKNSFDSFEGFISKAENIAPDSESLMYLKTLFDSYKAEVESSPNIAGNSDVLAAVKQNYELRYNKIVNSISLLKVYKNSVISDCNKALLEKNEKNYLEKEWDHTVENISTMPQKLLKAYNDLLSQIINYDCFEAIKQEINSIINNHAVDDMYKIKQMELRVNAAKVENYSSGKTLENLKLMNDYIALNEALGKPISEIPMEMEKLRLSVQALKQELNAATMMKYVSESLKTSMENLGYNILGHEEIRSEKQSIDKSYYDFSDNSAINVSTSENGAVLFEVVGKQKNLSGGQKELIKKDMEKFCPDYYDIKTELEKFGIKLEREKLYAPDISYARGINIEGAAIKSNERRSNNKKIRMMENDGN